MKSMINLLPTSQRRQQMLRKRAIQWSAAICLVLSIGWGWHWYALCEDQVLAQQYAGLVRECEPVQMMLKQLVGMRTQLEELQQQQAVASELEYQRHVLALLGAVSRAAQNAGGRLRVTKLEVSDFQSRPQNEAAKSPGTLVLNGVSLDYEAVAELLDSLQDSELFRRVELVMSKERPENEVAMRDYEIRCEL